jgi:polyisoprenyl-teichoic acid--peptidoglycan teichoic acid transferase
VKLWKRLMLLLLIVCMVIPTGLAESDADEEDWDLDIEDTNDSYIIDDDGNAYADIGEDEVIFDDEQTAAIEIMDSEIDDSIDPDQLDLNTNLPSNVVNILLVGVDTRSTTLDSGLQNGDVQIVVSINTDDGSIKLTSILRDLYVSIPGYKNKNRINVAYARGGGQLAMRTINKNFELNIESYIAINFYGLASIIDSLGGIDIEMTATEAKAINTYLKKHPPAYDNQDKSYVRESLPGTDGVHHCDGIQAVMYARLRKIDNDFGRTARQRKLMELLLEKVLDGGMSLTKLTDLLQACMPYVQTNMKASTLIDLALGVLRSGITDKLSSGESLIEEHRVPMDGTYSYLDVDGASVINMGSKSFPKNVQALHEFIYGEYIPAD